MLNGSLPLSVDARKLAGCEAVLEYCIAFSDLPRFASALLDDQGSVQARLAFARDEGNTVTVQSMLSTEVSLRCQRCLEPVRLAVKSACRYALLPAGADESAVPSQTEVLELTESLVLADLLEDELLLALPLVPAHPEGSCHMPGWNAGQEIPEARPNPFSVLAQLRQPS